MGFLRRLSSDCAKTKMESLRIAQMNFFSVRYPNIQMITGVFAQTLVMANSRKTKTTQLFGIKSLTNCPFRDST